MYTCRMRMTTERPIEASLQRPELLAKESTRQLQNYNLKELKNNRPKCHITRKRNTKTTM